MKHLLGICWIGFCLCLSRPAQAYQQGGHLMTANIIMHNVQSSRSNVFELNDREATLVALCTQLPDQSVDLDAIKVYLRVVTNGSTSWFDVNPNAWWKWGKSNDVSSDWTKRMVTVQQLLHGLTGGRSQAVRGIARQALEELSADAGRATPGPKQDAALCAMGFAMHLYGDSFAHSMMADPDAMYPTGQGHAKDKTYPDMPLYNDLQRFGMWEDYWSGAAQYITMQGSGGVLSPGLVTKIDTDVKDQCGHQSAISRFRHYFTFDDNEACFQNNLALNEKNSTAMADFFSKHNSEEPCETVLPLAMNALSLQSGGPRFTCLDAWKDFYAIVEPLFIDPRNSAAREALPGVNFDQVYMADPLLAADSASDVPHPATPKE